MTYKGKTQLPIIFLDRLREIVPAEQFEAVKSTFEQPSATGFRVNTLLADVEPVEKELIRAGLHLHHVTWKSDAFWISPSERNVLLDTPAAKENRVYIQNLASMLPPLALDPKPGERILDLAAAPGSKTLQIACSMHNQGELAAVELVKKRFFSMRANLKAQGATHVRTFLKNGEIVWRYRPEYFDRVLLDAPCSSEGRFHLSDPDTYAYWSLRKVNEMAKKQRRLLYSAVRCLRPGGVLVYSTCSFAPEENEAIIDRFLDTFADVLQLEPLDIEVDNLMPPLRYWRGKPFKHDLSLARRILPTETMEGFFICKMRKIQALK